MNCIEQNEKIDHILDSYKNEFGKDFEQYHNHVYRVFNFAIPFVESYRDIEILSIAAAFHDLGIWTNKTFDYINPSVELAKKYCLENGLDIEIFIEIETIIKEHHKLTKFKSLELVEIFRRADMTDLSLGLIRNGISRNDIRMIKKTFPNKGFHLNLSRLFFNNLLINPLRPLPMYKLLFLIFPFFTISLSGQNLKGVVLDQETKLPISYVSIGIVKKTGGTYADNDGKFYFTQSNYNNKDSIKFSCIGYKPITYLLTDLIKKYGEKVIPVYLDEKVIGLREVVVFSPHYKIIELGNRLSNKHILISGGQDLESGIVIKNNKKLFLDNVSFKLSHLDPILLDSVLIRFNIYYTKDGLPSDLILEKPIYFLLSNELKKDIINLDIKKYGIIVEHDFASTIEVIKKFGKGSFNFAGWITGSPTIYKYGKQGIWSFPTDSKRKKCKIYQSMILQARIEK